MEKAVNYLYDIINYVNISKIFEKDGKEKIKAKLDSIGNITLKFYF